MQTKILKIFDGGIASKKSLKAGVSLIAVLLFMLVATIAATATWKWITSEGKSSTSRMLKREAYQSAIAGIENTRAWMTTHGNDVGALIKQYYDGGNQPVKLNNRLTPLLRADQNYDVWLTGVNTEADHNFKLKILSKGVSRGNSSHTEVAVFNVDGLYQVPVPSESTPLDFDKAFAGSLGNLTNSPTIQSAIVNGDYGGNQPNVSEQLVVTGTVTLQGPKSGASGLAGADLYVGGDLKFNGNNSIGAGNNVVYVGGEFSCTLGNASVYVGGDLYVGGDVRSGCGVYVEGNMTVNGAFKRRAGAASANDKAGNECKLNGKTISLCVTQNLVFTENGSFNFSGDGNGKFWVGGDWYAPDRIEGNCSSGWDGSVTCGDVNGNRKSAVDGNVYRYNSSNYYSILQQGKNTTDGWESYNPNYGIYMQYTTQTGLGDDTESDDAKKKRIMGFAVASAANIKTSPAIVEWSREDDILKNVGASYWQNIDKMGEYRKMIDASTNRIPQPIVLKNADVNDDDSWKNKIANGRCRALGFTKFRTGTNNLIQSGDMENAAGTNAMLRDINNCYKKLVQLGDDVLFNGFMVVGFKGNAGTNMGQTANVIVNGKFIFYFTERISTAFYLPPTTSTSSILLYLPQGTGTTADDANQIHSATPTAGHSYNYFVFSEGFTAFAGTQINGSVVMGNNSTLRIDDGNTNLYFKKSVLTKLIEAQIIEQSEAYTNIFNSGAAAGGAIAAAGGKDNYYISNAPQLSITLVSQGESSETPPAGGANEANVASSFIILPRVIFLPMDPYGRLSDYYNVVNLNGGAITKNASNVSGCSEIPSGTNLLYNRAAGATPTLLNPGLYECKYTDNGITVPFYVMIQDELAGGVPKVNFDKEYQYMQATSESFLGLEHDPSNTNTQFEVTVAKTPSPTGWTITPVANLKEGSDCGSTSTECTFVLTWDASSSVNLFKVNTSNATTGTVNFSIVDCLGCLPEDPSSATFQIATNVAVHRLGMSDYCGANGPGYETAACSENGAYYEFAQADWPDCSTSDVWVRATGICVPDASTPNDLWSCENSTGASLLAVDAGVPAGCTAIIPSYELMSLNDDGNNYLYGSLKKNKVNFHLDFKGENLSSRSVTVTSDRLGSQTCYYSAKGCDYTLYVGDNITLTVDDTEFSYWQCDESNSADCLPNDPLPTGATYQINAVSGDNKVEAWFYQKDKHCFFDEFNTSRECSSEGTDWKYCFDYCESGSNCAIGEGNITNAKWIVLGDLTLRNKIQYSGGTIWLDDSHTRGKTQAGTGFLTILSSVNAGLYGTLRAQFQVPRYGRGDDISRARVDKSGFLLRSDNTADSYLMLNVFANADGFLTAKLCLGNNCETTVLDDENRVSSTDIVTLSATIRKADGGDYLDVQTVAGSYEFRTLSATFNLSGFSGYGDLGTNDNEFVGFRLSDPNFKLYDIGWKSETYSSQCWDTYPTVRCSFSAAYIGGVVPKDTETKPWVGLSSWFDKRGCSPVFQYNGDDACAAHQYDNNFYDCTPSSYTFTKEGGHGVIEYGQPVRMAQAKIQGCESYLSTGDRQYFETEIAQCGYFWVGKLNKCNEKVTVYAATSQARSISMHTGNSAASEISTDELFALSDDGVNMRSAQIQIQMTNESSNEVEVYLRSQTGTSNPVFSQPVIFRNSGTLLSFDVDEYSNVDGFDPEHVTGVVVRNLGPDANSSVEIVQIKTDCPYAPGLTCREAEYDPVLKKFRVFASVENAINASSYTLTAKKNGTDVTDLELSLNCSNLNNCPLGDASNNIVFSTPSGIGNSYNPYSESGAKNYQFYLSMKQKRGSTEIEAANSPCTTSVLSLTDVAVACRWNDYLGASTITIEKGTDIKDLYRYSVSCPTGQNCPYQILFGETPVFEEDKTGSTTGFTRIGPTKPGTIPDKDHMEVGSYVITLKSTASSEDFSPCVKQFEVVEKEDDSQKVTCRITRNTSVEGSLEGSLYIPASDVEVNNCGDGECSYIIKRGENVVGASTYSSGANLYFTGATEAGEHPYKLVIQRGSETAVKCGGDYKVRFPLNLSCGSFIDPGATTPVAAGTPITPPSPSVGSVSTYSGCDGKCTYEVTGISGYGGTDYDVTTTISSSFKDATASGVKEYNLVFKHPGASDVTCTFTVTYETASSSSAESSSSEESSSSQESSSSEESSSSIGNSIGCNNNNSAALANYVAVEKNKCYKYTTANSGNFYIGNWSGHGVSLTYVDCSGTAHTVTVANGDWTVYSVGGACSVFVKPAEDVGLQFNSY